MIEYLLVDFETRSLANLKLIGGRNYAADATTEVLCATLAAPSGYGWEYVDLWRPWRYPLLGAVPEVVVAHNATGFDRHIWARLGWPEPGRWLDSAVLARRAGYSSASLAAIGERYGVPKDAEGNKLTIGLSQRARKQPYQFMRDPNAVRDRVLAYCRSDVDLMARIVEDLAVDFDWSALPEDDRDWRCWEQLVHDVDLAVGDRGITFDSGLAREIIAAEHQNAAELCDAAGVTPAQMRSVPQFRQLARAPTARRADLQHRAGEPIVDARLACTSITAGKLSAGLSRVSPDGRLRDLTRYYGAHTGRWSGQGMQTQNIPRAAVPEDAEHRLASLSTEERGGLVRGCLTASPGNMLVVCDFAGIEARVLAWLADDESQLKLFRAGADPYKAIASVIFSCAIDGVSKDQRGIGKVAELALGYGMGSRKFEATAGRDKLLAAGVSAKKVVDLWRQRRDPVVQFWGELQYAWARQDGPYYPYSDDALRLQLPSGRELVYRDADVDSYVGRGNQRIRVYGGLLVENMVQAASRDLLAAALVQAEVAGLNPVMHVHDEIVCDVPAAQADAALEQLCAIMSEAEAPEWAAGCPISSEGYVAFRYKK